MADEFKRLDRELVYKGSIIDFYKDTVQVPNGNIVKWDFNQAPGCGGSGAGYRGWKAADGKAVPECIGQAYSGNPGRRLNGPEEPTMEPLPGNWRRKQA